MKINQVVERKEPGLKVTTADIHQIKREHILANLLYSPKEAGEILGGKSERYIQELVKEGKLDAADESAARGRKMSCGYRITAESLARYRSSIVVPPEKWKE